MPVVRALMLWLSFSLLAGCSSIPHNQPDAPNANAPYTDRVGRHVYAGTGIGTSWLEPDSSELAGSIVNDRVSAGGQVTLGMDVSRQLSLELHTADLGSAGISPDARVNYNIHGVSALLYAGKQRHNYKRRGLSGYGRIGLGVLDNSTVGDIDFVQDSETNLLAGAGLEYMTHLGLGLRAEAIAYKQDVRYGQVALVFRTGTRREREAAKIVTAPAPKPVPTPVLRPVAPELQAALSVCDNMAASIDGGNFHHDSSTLTDAGSQLLEAAADILKDCTAVPFSIVAHTDSVGSNQYNQDLSERRAQAVIKLFSERGISPHRMTKMGMGETQPIDTNDTLAGRQRNRRVELFPQ